MYRRQRKWRGWLMVLLVFGWQGVRAAPLVLDSGEEQLTLLELFTSQGCSSCPPAERWLNSYLHKDALWREVVPVAWHVDYWDYIGWKDPFAHPEFGERQRKYAQGGGARTVYTPEFFLNGREWRGWTLRLPPRASDRRPGNLHVEVKDGQLHARFPANGQAMRLHATILGSGLVTDIARGENRNSTLVEEFVVLDHRQADSASGEWQLDLPATGYAGAQRYALACWVSTTGSARPVQAAGGWLEAPGRQ